MGKTAQTKKTMLMDVVLMRLSLIFFLVVYHAFLHLHGWVGQAV
jgi:hypothetical protein